MATYAYGFNADMLGIVKALPGRILGAVLTTDECEEKWHRSFETFVLRFAEEDIEFTTKEVLDSDWFTETNTVEVFPRPNRDSWFPYGERMGIRQRDGRVKWVKRDRKFVEFPIGRKIDAVSVVTATLHFDASKCNYGKESGSGDYVRAIVLHFGDDAIVFDKGGTDWSVIWDVKRCKSSELEFPTEDDPKEYPECMTTLRIDRYD